MNTPSVLAPRPVDSVVAPIDVDRERAWVLAGLAAAVSAITGIVASGAAGAVYDRDIAGNAVAITERTAEQVPQILTFHVATTAASLLLLVFAAGLRRHLDIRLPSSSLLPAIASSGLMLVSVAGLLGSGLTTEFVFGVAEPDRMVPETVAMFGHWINTIPWLWGGAGVTALAVCVASLRHGAAARWIGWASLGLGGLITLVAVSPLQYMAGLLGPVWLVLLTVGLLVGARRRA